MDRHFRNLSVTESGRRRCCCCRTGSYEKSESWAETRNRMQNYSCWSDCCLCGLAYSAPSLPSLIRRWGAWAAWTGLTQVLIVFLYSRLRPGDSDPTVRVETMLWYGAAAFLLEMFLLFQLQYAYRTSYLLIDMFFYTLLVCHLALTGISTVASVQSVYSVLSPQHKLDPSQVDFLVAAIAITGFFSCLCSLMVLYYRWRAGMRGDVCATHAFHENRRVCEQLYVEMLSEALARSDFAAVMDEEHGARCPLHTKRQVLADRQQSSLYDSIFLRTQQQPAAEEKRSTRRVLHAPPRRHISEDLSRNNDDDLDSVPLQAPEEAQVRSDGDPIPPPDAT